MKPEFARRNSLLPDNPRLDPAAWTLALALLLIASPHRGAAATPTNDLCAGAQVIPRTGPFPYATPVVDVSTATTSAGDPDLGDFLSNRVQRSVWYRFTPATTGVYTITSCSDAGAATTVADTVLGVYTSAAGCNGPFIRQGNLGDEDCGPNSSQASVTLQLLADTAYYAVVWKFCDNCTDDGLNLLQLVVTRSTIPINDSCAGAIPVTVNIPVNGTTVGAGNTYQIVGTNAFRGLDQTPSRAFGRDVVYSFTAPITGTYSFKVYFYDVNQDLVLYVGPTCPTGTIPIGVGNALAAANRSLVNSAEEIVCQPLAAGQKVFAFVDDESIGNQGSSFIFEVTRCVPEREPNDSPERASPLACGIEGSIAPQFDVDFFALGHYPAGWRAFALLDGEAAKNADFDLRITTDVDVLEYDNDNNDETFGESSPNVAGTPLPEASTFLVVNYNSNLRASEPYRLYALVQPPIGSAVRETEPNDSPAQANSADQNYFYGTLSGPAPSTDVDLYAFSVLEGDLVFLSLDGDPYRTNAPINARLQLLDATGSTLVTVDDRAFGSTTNGLAGLFPTSPAEGLAYRSPDEGTFYARVSTSPSATGNAGAGAYLLSISKNCIIGSLGQNHPPVITNLTVPATVIVSANITLTGTIWELDSGDAPRLSVNWGDGATSLVEYAQPGRFEFSVTHAYTSVNTNVALSLTVTDKNGGVATTNLSVQVRPNLPRFNSISAPSFGRVHLQLLGMPRVSYRIEKSDRIGSWSTLGTATADANGQFAVDDLAPSSNTRFYRALEQ